MQFFQQPNLPITPGTLMIWTFFLYLTYGLAFFTLGVAVFSRDIHLSELRIARIIWLLAAFGLVHGFHEWLELLLQIKPELETHGFALMRLVIVSLSFLFLLYFGIFLNIITFFGEDTHQTTPFFIKMLVGVAVLALTILAIAIDDNTTKDNTVRLLIGFPGGALSGIGLMLYSRTVRTFSVNVAANFILAGSFMACYAILTGLVPSDVIIPYTGVNVVFFRGLCAFFIMVFTIRALSVFNLEQQRIVKEQLQRLAHSEKLISLGFLASGIAHEINTPLTNISLNCEMLKDLLPANEKTDRKLKAIDRNVNRASRIAGELLHFSREKETDLHPTDINRVIESSINLLANQELCSIITFLPGKVSPIAAIPWKLEEVVVNLLLNSLDACNENDSVTVRSRMHSNRVEMIITDTGHGIAEEIISQVFDPFFTTKEVGKGTGMGLAVCYNIIRQHSGEISLVNTSTRGAKATISFPVPTHGQ